MRFMRSGIRSLVPGSERLNVANFISNAAYRVSNGSLAKLLAIFGKHLAPHAAQK